MKSLENTLLLCTPIIFSIGFITTYLSTPIVAWRMRRLGIVGVDVHKLSKPTIPEMCGLSIIFGLAVSTVASAILLPNLLNKLSAFILSILICGAVGVIDDLKPLSVRLNLS